MALFGRKKGEEEGDSKGSGGTGNGAGGGPGGAAGSGDGGDARAAYSSGKAQVFFDRAKTAHETTNYEYAMTLWLNGLRQDPTNMKGLEAFMQSAQAYTVSSGGKPPSKETMKTFDGKSDLDRYLSALLHQGVQPLNPLLAVQAVEASAKLGLPEPTHWLGERAIVIAAQEKRPRKDLFKRLMKAFGLVGAFDRAVLAGEQAVKLDPMDGRLAAEVRNLAAQSTMSKGGYEQSGQAGGYKANIKDLNAQRRLEEDERIVKTDEVLDRKVKEAEEEYRTRPEDQHTIMRYAKSLAERGRPEDLSRARAVLKRAYEETRQFRFREMDGDLKLRIARAKLGEFRDKAQAEPKDGVAQKRYAAAQQEFLRMEIEEYRLRVENYPTDLGFKFELGKRLFDTGDIDNAIPLFQQSQEEAKRRVESQYFLAQSFQKIDYIDEAINTYRQAMETHKLTTDETGMALRYGLMTALQVKAEKERELAAAEEADRLASSIAVQQFSYRDIRQRRDAVKKLIGEIKRGDGA